MSVCWELLGWVRLGVGSWLCMFSESCHSVGINGLGWLGKADFVWLGLADLASTLGSGFCSRGVALFGFDWLSWAGLGCLDASGGLVGVTSNPVVSLW